MSTPLEVLPRRGGRPRSEAPKILISIRFDVEVVEAFKSTGKGWQTRMNDALKEWLKALDAEKPLTG